MVIYQTDGSKARYQTESIDSITFEKGAVQQDAKPGVIVTKVYGDGTTYCAFTSLIKRNNDFYLAFREGATHVAEGDYGVIRVLKSSDGERWENYGTLKTENVDLRDPNLSVMPDGNLLIICGARMKTPDGTSYCTKTYYSKESNNEFEEAKEVSVPSNIADLSCWIWRLTWYDNIGYGVAYRSNDGRNFNLSLLKTDDGVDYNLITTLDVPDTPSETRLRFKAGGTMYAMVRRAGANLKGGKGYFGKSNPPYTEWEWDEIGIYLAGQDFIIDGENIICATRMSQNIGEFTSVYAGNLEGDFRWNYILPSSGTSSDTAYTGIIKENDEYWVSYYSMHETEKPSVYIARIPQSYMNK